MIDNNILINSEKYEKYKNYFYKMLDSPYLSKLIYENKNSEIKTAPSNKTEDSPTGISEGFYILKKENIMKGLLSMGKKKAKEK